MATARLTSQARRAAILNAAVKLFSEKGFRGVTTRELAAATGVSEPVLYQHFQTKSDLYRALIEERAESGERRIPTCFDGLFENAASDRDFLIRLANGIIHWHTSDPAYVRLLMFSALEHHELSELFYEHYSLAFFQGLTAYFERRIRDGAFRPVEPSIATHTFISLVGHYAMNVVVFQHCRGGMALSQEHVVEGFVDIFLEGIKRHS